MILAFATYFYARTTFPRYGIIFDARGLRERADALTAFRYVDAGGEAAAIYG